MCVLRNFIGVSVGIWWQIWKGQKHTHTYINTNDTPADDESEYERYELCICPVHKQTLAHTHRGQSERERVLCGLEAYCIHLLLLLVYECAVFCFLTGPQGGDWLWALASRALVAFSCASTFFVSHRFLSFLTFSFSLCILLALFSTRTLFTVTNLWQRYPIPPPPLQANGRIWLFSWTLQQRRQQRLRLQQRQRQR